MSERKWEQLKNEIVRKIMIGEYPIGSKIPTIVELMDIYKVGKTTVQTTIQSLIQDGLLETRVGDGCYVRKCNTALLKRTYQQQISQEFDRLVAECFSLGMTDYEMSVALNEAILNYHSEG